MRMREDRLIRIDRGKSLNGKRSTGWPRKGSAAIWIVDDEWMKKKQI